MFCVRIGRLRHSLAFRLTLWYAGIFVLSAGAAFALFYLLSIRIINQRMDDDLLAQTDRLVQVYTLEGRGMLQRAALLQAQAAGEKKIFLRLFYPSGVMFFSSNMSYWNDIEIDRRAVELLFGENGRPFAFVTQKLPRSPYPARIIYRRIGGSIVLQLGYSMENESRLLQTFKHFFMFTMAAFWVPAMAMGWFMARRALSGVALLTRTALRISEQDLDTRVPVGRRQDEIDRLALTFNQMLDRIKQLVTGTRQMNDNIAHDLRSPVTRIRGLAEVTLTKGSSQEEYAQMAASTIEECDRLLHMINTMLTISRTESGVDAIAFQPMDLAQTVRTACTLFQPLAEDKAIGLQCMADGACMVSGNEAMLQRLVANLLDNAIKYTPAGGTVSVETKQRARAVVLAVRDNGPGISYEDQSRIFERFFRGEQSRSPAGAGLGLSLAQAIARAHGGAIELYSTPGQGSVFTLHLPAA